MANEPNRGTGDRQGGPAERRPERDSTERMGDENSSERMRGVGDDMDNEDELAEEDDEMEEADEEDEDGTI